MAVEKAAAEERLRLSVEAESNVGVEKDGRRRRLGGVER